ncbi:MAG TPA: efflux RND transporter periplasmic adaptor subunit [Thermoanaerobaculia bacterium]|nr:efflux RND transporter periplasmic adaptor subunit [Thermoanaerobaculia bacterium]
MLKVVSLLALVLPALGCAGRSESGTLAPHSVDLKAEVVASRVASVTAPFDVTVRRVAVREGQSVNAGDVLLELTNPEVERNVEIARIQTKLAEFGLHSAARPPAPRKSAEAAAAKIVALKKAKVERYKSLLPTHDVTLQEVEDAENELAAATRDLVAVQNQNAPPAAPHSRRVAEIELERARAEERLAESRRQTLTIRAPIAGVVTRLSAVEGRDAGAREPLAEVTAMAPVDVRAEVAPDLLRIARPGTLIEVKVLSVPPRVFLDKVAYVVPARPNVQGEPRAAIVATLANADGALQPGTPATMTIHTQP